ncbi:MAG: FAD-binding protein [Bryobacteraceae bacterium]
MISPQTPQELADALRQLASAGRTIHLGGAFTKTRLGGPIAPADETVSTAGLRRLLQYEPKDLTISVEAGMPWSELEAAVAANGQMIPLDPLTGPGWEAATVGGVIGANLSGPRRRLYGTARDMVIGMTFATLEGKLVQSGGMVVKNVAGLDMAKLMIGSYGTLAAVAIVNFKLFPIPPASRTFVLEFATVAEAFARRDEILTTILPPAAIDIVNWPSSVRLLIRATGDSGILGRFTQEFKGARWVEGADEEALWREVREFTPRFLAANPKGGVEAIRSAFSDMPSIAGRLQVPFIARAGSGVIYAHHPSNASAEQIHDPTGIMKKIKHMFDPDELLNKGRLHGYV